MGVWAKGVRRSIVLVLVLERALGLAVSPALVHLLSAIPRGVPTPKENDRFRSLIKAPGSFAISYLRR
jgi:flagellar biogenesis protein FliO